MLHMNVDENLMPLFVSTLVFMAFYCLAIFLSKVRNDTLSSDALSKLGYIKMLSPLHPLVKVLGECLLPMMSWTHRERVQNKLSQAGFENTPAQQYFALQICLSVFFMALSLFLIITFDLNAVMTTVPFFSISLFAGLLIPSHRLIMLHKARCLEIKQGWPFFLDLLMISLHSGMGFESALRMTMSVLNEGAIKSVWNHYFHALKMGGSKSAAFATIESRLNMQIVSTFISMVSFSEKSGSSLLRQLEQQSIKLRSDQYIHAEECAQRLPFKMMFPLAICFFPCTFLVISYPVIRQLMSALQ